MEYEYVNGSDDRWSDKRTTRLATADNNIAFPEGVLPWKIRPGLSVLFARFLGGAGAPFFVYQRDRHPATHSS